MAVNQDFLSGRDRAVRLIFTLGNLVLIQTWRMCNSSMQNTQSGD